MPHPNYHVNLHALTKQIYNYINFGYVGLYKRLFPEIAMDAFGLHSGQVHARSAGLSALLSQPAACLRRFQAVCRSRKLS